MVAPGPFYTAPLVASKVSPLAVGHTETHIAPTVAPCTLDVASTIVQTDNCHTLYTTTAHQYPVTGKCLVVHDTAPSQPDTSDRPLMRIHSLHASDGQRRQTTHGHLSWGLCKFSLLLTSYLALSRLSALLWPKLSSRSADLKPFTSSQDLHWKEQVNQLLLDD